ncbi:MAG TPA: universal stress protein [Terriglobales bacterium]|nr:universal stress protein [Terriglobales bacterium]
MAETTAASPPIAPKNILATTDFSPASLAAVHYAAAWARRLGAALHVANFVLPQETTVAAGYGPGVDLEALLDSARRGLAQVEADPLLQGLPLATHLREATVEEGMAALIAELHIDLVVAASAGRRGLRKFIVGSTAEAIFRHVPCPVLLLGPGIEPHPLPATGPATAPRQILFATDFGPAATRALAFARTLAQAWSSGLRLLTVLPQPDPEALQLAQADAAAARLRALLPPEARATTPVQVEFGAAAAAIVGAAAAIPADLIVLGARHQPAVSLYTGWATAYQVLCHAPCPVLTVRAPA